MIKPDRELVRRLRQRVRAEVKASPALQRERKRTRVGWRHRQYTWNAFRFLIPIGVGVALFTDLPVERVSAFLALWSAVVLLNRATQIGAVLRAPAWLMIFYHQPVGDAEVFRHQRAIVSRSSLWLGVDWLVFALVAAAKSHSIVALCVAPLFAMAQWAAALALATVLIKTWPRFPYAAVTSVSYVAFIVLAQTQNSPALAIYNRALLDFFSTFTPAGAIARAFASLLEGRLLGILALCAVVIVAGAVLRWSHAALRRAFSLEQIFDYGASESLEEDASHDRELDLAAGETAPPLNEPARKGDLDPVVDLRALEASLTHALEESAGLTLFRRGFLERYLTRALSFRQRVLVDFLQPRTFSWSRGWLISLGLVGLARLLAYSGVSVGATAALAFAGLAICALPVFGVPWLGFSAIDSFQSRIGVASFFPIGFSESARLLLKIALLRSLAGLPLLVLAVRFATGPTLVDWGESLNWALRGWVVVLALQPLWVIMAFSKNSNDSSARAWFSAVLIVLILSGIILVGATGVMIFAVDDVALALLAGAVLLGFSYGVLLGYGWCYNRGIFDLIARPRTA